MFSLRGLFQTSLVRYLDLDCGLANQIGKRSMKSDTATQGNIGMPWNGGTARLNFVISEISRKTFGGENYNIYTRLYRGIEGLSSPPGDCMLAVATQLSCTLATGRQPLAWSPTARCLIALTRSASSCRRQPPSLPESEKGPNLSYHHLHKDKSGRAYG